MPQVLPYAVWAKASTGSPIAGHGDPFDIPMWYCPGVSETLISPDHVCRESEHYNIVDSHHDVVQDVGHIRFSSKSGFSVRELSLTRANGLWYVARLVPGTSSLDPTLAGSLRALFARMPDTDAPVVLPDAPTGPAPVLRVSNPRPCLSSDTNVWDTPV